MILLNPVAKAGALRRRTAVERLQNGPLFKVRHHQEDEPNDSALHTLPIRTAPAQLPELLHWLQQHLRRAAERNGLVSNASPK